MDNFKKALLIGVYAILGVLILFFVYVFSIVYFWGSNVTSLISGFKNWRSKNEKIICLFALVMLISGCSSISLGGSGGAGNVYGNVGVSLPVP